MSRKFCGGCKKERTPLSQHFPPCPCEKCKLKRACGIPDRDQKRQAVRKCQGDCRAAKRDFSAFLGEFGSIVAFFVIATAMFWLTVSRQLCVAAVKLQKSNRNVKMTALVIAALLLLSMTFKVLRHTVQLKCQARARARVKQAHTAQQLGKAITCTGVGKQLPHVKATPRHDSGGGGDGAGGVGSCMLRWGRRVKPNATVGPAAAAAAGAAACANDPKAREVFKQSKLYAIPAEMKQPPGFLVYLREILLRHSPFATAAS